MTTKFTRIVLLSLSLLALPASADSECAVAVDLWDLELEKVERISGDAEIRAVATALGTRALVRGGYQNPARTRDAVRASMVGSTDGLGLSISLQKAAP
jgi:hypothetical protein